MKISVNGKLIGQNSMSDHLNRGFLFGDGLFETIIVSNGKIRFFDDHFKRLANGMQVLGLKSGQIQPQKLEKEMLELVRANELVLARVKVIVWRKNGTLSGYNGDNTDIEYMIIAVQTSAPALSIRDKISLAKKVQLPFTITSSCKTVSALPYVLACNERNERKLDDLVLTDYDGHVSECTSSNIFWIEGNELFTPPLSTGCIQGIMRTQISKSIGFKEQSITYDDLTKKDIIISTNIAGISVFSQIDNRKLKTQHPIIEKLRQLLVL